MLITGGSRGLGLLLAREALSQGARVAICGRDAPTLDHARSDLTAREGGVLALSCDVTSRADVHEAVGRVLDHWGGIDVLIDNAGVIQVGPVETMTVDDYRLSMETHFSKPVSPLPRQPARR